MLDNQLAVPKKEKTSQPKPKGAKVKKRSDELSTICSLPALSMSEQLQLKRA
jgi:hypothetical protein